MATFDHYNIDRSKEYEITLPSGAKAIIKTIGIKFQMGHEMIGPFHTKTISKPTVICTCEVINAHRYSMNQLNEISTLPGCIEFDCHRNVTTLGYTITFKCHDFMLENLGISLTRVSSKQVLSDIIWKT